MHTDRRGFLRILFGLLAWLGVRPAPATAAPTTFEIHQATRNTTLGALGSKLAWRRTQGPPFKTYPGEGRIPLARSSDPNVSLLDAVERYRPARTFTPGGLTASQLGRLLQLSNGMTARRKDELDHGGLRAAPSAGALYAGEVYVVVLNVHGLEPATYYYDVADHALVRIGDAIESGKLAAALEPGSSLGTPAAAVAITNVFDRYAWKYANRGYRYALIDTGHIGENLRLAAVADGLGEARPARFHDDAFGELLGVDGQREAVCAVHLIGEAQARRVTSGVQFPSRVALRATPLGGPGDKSITRAYHTATKLVPGLPREPLAARPTDSPALGRELEVVPVASLRSSPKMSVDTAVRRRRSPSSFANAKVTLTQLATALHCAQSPAAAQLSIGIDLYVAAHAVEGLERGLYRYRPADGKLVRLIGGDLRGPMAKACLGQRKAAAASAGFLMVARLQEAEAAQGARSYRDLLIESGEVGERIYLAAEALGLAARNLAAFRDDELNRLMKLDGRKLAVVHLTMFGHEA